MPLENPNVDLYRYDPTTQTWSRPLTGPVYSNPAYIERSSLADGWKRIGVEVSYEGRVGEPNGHTLIESVSFHDERCYRASTEFGFSHYVKGLPGDGNIYFYHEIHANCQPKGKCREHGTQDVLVDQRVNIPIVIPTGSNHEGGAVRRYEAYLVDGGAKWRIRVVDPHTHEPLGPPTDHAVQAFFQPTAKDFFDPGATGYVTATAIRDGDFVFSAKPPLMNIEKIYSAK